MSIAGRARFSASHAGARLCDSANGARTALPDEKTTLGSDRSDSDDRPWPAQSGVRGAPAELVGTGRRAGSVRAPFCTGRARRASCPCSRLPSGLRPATVRGNCVDCFFPGALKEPRGDLGDAVAAAFGPGTATVRPERIREFVLTRQPSLGALLEADRELIATLLPTDRAISSTPEAFLKLHLLSHRLALPNSMNLDGIFAHLQTVAWTTEGAIALADLPGRQLQARLDDRYFEVLSVDKFPKMANYVVPSGVRIADSSRIRLGAYLGEGTTVMPSGAVNFNAAALGPNMVEGRVSQGVVLGEGSDLGGGASTMGTLAGGGEITITIGRQCLIGATAARGYRSATAARSRPASTSPRAPG